MFPLWEKHGVRIALATLGDYTPLPGLPVNIIPLLFSFFSC